MRIRAILLSTLGLAQSTAARPGGRRTSFPLQRSSSGGNVGRGTKAPGFEWGEEPMRGVNIGGWLVLEPWITPSLFDSKPPWVIDEYTYGAFMRSQNDSMSEIRGHWDEWFQYNEIENIAAIGLNTIRIQIGYWSLIELQNGEPFLVGAYEYLKKAVGWAQGLNLKVMLDLHGAPGGQNGFDNSGLRTTREWFRNDTNLHRTLDALQVLTAEFTQPSYGGTVQTIELINEPFPYTPDEIAFLRRFYQEAYDTVNKANRQDKVVVAIDSAFQPWDSWNGFMTEPDYHNIAFDVHIYSMFDLTLLTMGYNTNLQWTCSQRDRLIAANRQHWTIVGEFTPANTDCAKWLNGRGAGARYDNTLQWANKVQFAGDCRRKTGPDGSPFGADYVEHLAKSFEAQTWVYEQALDHVDVEDGTGGRLVDVDGHYVRWAKGASQLEEADEQGWIPNPIWSKPHGQAGRIITRSELTTV